MKELNNKKIRLVTIKEAEEYSNGREDIKNAWLRGYIKARKDSTFTWSDISCIIRIAFAEYPNLKEIDYDCSSIFQNIANKANKEIFGRHYF